MFTFQKLVHYSIIIIKDNFAFYKVLCDKNDFLINRFAFVTTSFVTEKDRRIIQLCAISVQARRGILKILFVVFMVGRLI